MSIECNTSASQWFVVETGYDIASLGVPQTAFDLLDKSYNLPSKPLNITDAVGSWAVILQAMLFLYWQPYGYSILGPSVAQNNLGSIDIGFSGNSFRRNLSTLDWILNSGPNTPAEDYWTLQVQLADPGGFAPNFVPISFLPTGEIDFTHTTSSDYENITTTLLPSAQALKLFSGNQNIDLWEFINWTFVSLYWIFLADFGQTAPTIHGGFDSNLALAYPFTSQNNIFTNETLFNIYYSYLRNTILPILQLTPNAIDFLPLSKSNQLVPIQTTFLRSYSCVERRIKGWLSATILVIVADYTFIVGMYNFISFMAGWWQKRKDRKGAYKNVEMDNV